MSDKYRHECPEGCKVFIGNLDRMLRRDRIRHIFGEFGRIRDVWLATNPPGFGFVMYEHKTDAKRAVEEMNNQSLCGRILTVELATGLKRPNGDEMGDQRDRRPARDGDYRRDSHRSGSGERRTRYKSGRYDRSGDRCFYSTDFQPKTSPSERKPRRRRSDSESNDRRTRSPEKRDDRQRRDDDKSRSRRRTSDH